VLQIGVLREDWLFVVGFVASLALLRRVQAPDGAALITAVLISGKSSNNRTCFVPTVLLEPMLSHAGRSVYSVRQMIFFL
jgi:hypothetical protein